MEPQSRRRWALILGASSGMGRACALSFASRGVNIAGVHLDSAKRQPKVNDLIQDIKNHGVEALFFNSNAANAKAQTEIVQAIRRDTDDVAVLVHSLSFGALAPYVPPGADAEAKVISRLQMDMTLTVMAHSLVYWVQELVTEGLLCEGAKVFSLTSAGDVRVFPSYGAVSAAKGALEAHVRQLAVELAPRGIAVNAIRAGITRTPSLERIPGHEELISWAERYNPHGRLTTPEDVGEAIALLSEPRSSWITGSVIGVDGGENLVL